MAYMNISTVLTDLENDRDALGAALKLAQRDGGHLDGLCIGIDRSQPGFYYAGAHALAVQSTLEQAEKEAKSIELEVQDFLEGRDQAWEIKSMPVQLTNLSASVAHHIRYSDIVVLARPYGNNRGHENEAIVEAALFDAGIPVLVIPDGKTIPDQVERIVVAWNGSPEALTAIRAAMPMLKMADVVNVAIIDPPTHAPDRSDPGGALSTMLARHGINAEISVLAKTMPRVSDVISRHVLDQKADLLVMGAYGHSRIRESILGGATRNMLQMAELPVLMAH